MTALAVLIGLVFGLISPVAADMAVPAPMALATSVEVATVQQEPPAAETDKDVHITFTDEENIRVNPVWVAIAVVAALIVVVLAVAAARGGGGTTVVRG